MIYLVDIYLGNIKKLNLITASYFTVKTLIRLPMLIKPSLEIMDAHTVLPAKSDSDVMFCL